ncbi:type IV pilus biogenesis/stability protein PilW [Halomonas vilamensis]|uniref:Type IV pilus biogenesis/stability protein PilW n=1 Tax=Vreelandella vilamensis TaxID=531309 RepID=A0ABU1H811_9GAMM|nr:type IV pilus biogenesis/stability protein PilW [Halomonas vilamensis]MDR5899817.1 type IV pilus biogenesis/stability protein PilW [Halomonas vilamensis]
MLTVLVSTLWLAGCASLNDVPSENQPEAANAYTQLGVAYLERENLPRALNALDRALEIDPKHPEALQALALVYQQQGDTALADEHFQKALDAAPEFTQARNNYAAFLYQQTDYARACEQLARASQDAQYARRAQLFTNLGQCYTAQEKIDRARESFTRAQQIDPRHARSYLLLAELEFSQGNTSQAWTSLQTFMQLAAPNRQALELAIEIANARGEFDMAADYQRQLGQLD